VSHPTVSRALRNSPLVNRDTAERIRKIAVRMGYRTNSVARSLVTRKTRTIGVVVTTITDPFIGEVVGGIEEAANELGYSVVLADSNADPDRERHVVLSFHERRVDGIIVTASRVGALHLPLLRQSSVPIVLINNQHPDDGGVVHSVLIDNVNASLAAMRHLIELGHTRIGYIGDAAGFHSDTERFGGYRQALALADIPFVPEYAVHGDGRPESGESAMQRLLALPTRPSAIFCYNDMSALGAMRAIYAGGLSVPGDISVIGFDDLFFASYTRPGLTTIRQPKRTMGRIATEAMVKLLSGGKSGTSIRVQGELIVRESTARVR